MSKYSLSRIFYFTCVATTASLGGKSIAGWFGPSTYNECVLDEMKGRPQYMMPTVEEDCKTKFCYRRDITEAEKQSDRESQEKCQQRRKTNPNWGKYSLFASPEEYLECFSYTNTLVCK